MNPFSNPLAMLGAGMPCQKRITLKPAVQTANYAKYAKGKRVEWTKAFTRWMNRSSIPIRSAFAWFACFAVPSAFSRIISEKWGAHAPRVSCSARSPNTGDVQVMRWRKSSGFPSVGRRRVQPRRLRFPDSAGWCRPHNRAERLRKSCDIIARKILVIRNV